MNWASSMMSSVARSSGAKPQPAPKRQRVDKNPSTSDKKNSKEKPEVVASRKEFDLNMEDVLEQWEVPDALRELLCNAEDETMLATDSMGKVKESSIDFDEDGVCHIRDFGRGLHYKHFTQCENPEKLEAFDDPTSGVVGRFGVGMKDGLGVLHRNNVQVLIRSRYQDVTLAMISKHSCGDVTTLHAVVVPPSAPSMQGTDFALTGVRVMDVEVAKAKFLRYKPLVPIKSVTAGSVLRKKRSDDAAIYFRGLKLLDLTSDMLFSYNIQTANAALKKALNRERQSVGFSAFSSLVQRILLAEGDGQEEVTDLMCKNIGEKEQGDLCEELKRWSNVKAHFIKEQTIRGEADAKRHEVALHAREEARDRENQAALEAKAAAERAKAQQAKARRRREEEEEARRQQEEARQELKRKEEERLLAEEHEKQKEDERLRQIEEHKKQVAHEQEMARLAEEARLEAIRLGQEQEAELLRQEQERQRQEALEKERGRRDAEARLEAERLEKQREAEELRKAEEVKRKEAHEKELARQAAEEQRKAAEARRVELEWQQLAKEQERREAQEKLLKKTREEEGIAEENRHKVVMFVTFDEMKNPGLRQSLDQARRSHKLVEVSDSDLQRAMTKAQARGSTVLSFAEYRRKLLVAYNPSVVAKTELTRHEMAVWARKDAILQLVGGCPRQVRSVVVAERIHPFKHLAGVWMPHERTIFISRGQLQCEARFAGTLLHEAAHAKSGAADATQLFEEQLTKWLGTLASKMIASSATQVES